MLRDIAVCYLFAAILTLAVTIGCTTYERMITGDDGQAYEITGSTFVGIPVSETTQPVRTRHEKQMDAVADWILIVNRACLVVAIVAFAACVSLSVYQRTTGLIAAAAGAGWIGTILAIHTLAVVSSWWFMASAAAILAACLIGWLTWDKGLDKIFRKATGTVGNLIDMKQETEER